MENDVMTWRTGSAWYEMQAGESVSEHGDDAARALLANPECRMSLEILSGEVADRLKVHATDWDKLRWLATRLGMQVWQTKVVLIAKGLALALKQLDEPARLYLNDRRGYVRGLDGEPLCVSPKATLSVPGQIYRLTTAAKRYARQVISAQESPHQPVSAEERPRIVGLEAAERRKPNVLDNLSDERPVEQLLDRLAAALPPGRARYLEAILACPGPRAAAARSAGLNPKATAQEMKRMARAASGLLTSDPVFRELAVRCGFGHVVDAALAA